MANVTGYVGTLIWGIGTHVSPRLPPADDGDVAIHRVRVGDSDVSDDRRADACVLKKYERTLRF